MKLKSKITAADMKVLRLVKGVTRRDRVRNGDIYEQVKIKPIIETIQTDQLVRSCNETRRENHGKESTRSKPKWEKT